MSLNLSAEISGNPLLYKEGGQKLIGKNLKIICMNITMIQKKAGVSLNLLVDREIQQFK